MREKREREEGWRVENEIGEKGDEEGEGEIEGEAGKQGRMGSGMERMESFSKRTRGEGSKRRQEATGGKRVRRGHQAASPTREARHGHEGHVRVWNKR